MNPEPIIASEEFAQKPAITEEAAAEVAYDEIAAAGAEAPATTDEAEPEAEVVDAATTDEAAEAEAASAAFAATRARIDTLFERNPAYAPVYLGVFDFCGITRAEFDAIEHCESLLTSRYQIQTAPAIIDILVDAGGLSQDIFVNDEPYAGTFDTLRTDESVPDDAQITVQLTTTPAAAEAAAAYREQNSLAALIAQNPGRQPAFELVLELCEAPEGKTTKEIQAVLHEANLLEPQATNGVETLHASYFTGALETVGALAWDGNVWKSRK